MRILHEKFSTVHILLPLDYFHRFTIKLPKFVYMHEQKGVMLLLQLM